MLDIINIIIFVAWSVAFLLLVSTRQSLRLTNARSAHRWAIAASLLLGLVFLLTICSLKDQFIKNEALWYMVAILLLSPFVAILGARRPTNKYWSLFVVLPMLLVLGFPLLVTWVGGSLLEEFAIQPPVLIGFFLVLVMGVGNYLGTQFTISAFLTGCSVVLIVVPLTTTVPGFFPSREVAFPASVIVHLLSIYWVYFLTKRKDHSVEITPQNRIWFDFSNLFGAVWAKRIAEQFNRQAEENQWQVRLERQGFEWQEAADEQHQTEVTKHINKQLRWAFNRFVQEEWIDHYLKDAK